MAEYHRAKAEQLDFEKHDADGDGLLSWDEWKASLGPVHVSHVLEKEEEEKRRAAAWQSAGHLRGHLARRPRIALPASVAFVCYAPQA